MKRVPCCAALLLALSACAEKVPTDHIRVPTPQRDHTASQYPADWSVGAMTPMQLTSWAGVDRTPTWSPDGGRIAFASNRFTGNPASTSSSIYVMPATGDALGLVRLTTGTADSQPTWSPDGSTIAFVRFGGIYRVPSAGGGAHALIPQGQGASDPRYSPDGARLAFSMINQVFVMPANGGAAVQVTPDGAINVFPEWLDANTLLYTQIVNGAESVWKITVGDATSATRLTPSEPGMFRYADMNRAASILAFMSDDIVFQDMNTQLHTIGRMNIQPATDPATANVEFSPTGKVLFVAANGATSSYDIFVADIPPLRSRTDRTPPVVNATVTGKVGENGWFISDVMVDFDVADPESGIRSQHGCDDKVITSDGAHITLTCTATNGADMQTAKSVSFDRDAAAPAVAFAGTLSYRLDEQVRITCSAMDETSGVALTTCPPVASGPAYQFDAYNTVAAAAGDNAGNSGTGTVAFTVTATVGSLSGVLAQMVPEPGIANSLSARLRAAANARTEKARASQMTAFINEVRAQVGQWLTQEQAAVLIRWANTL